MRNCLMQSIYEFSWQAEAEVELRRLAEEPDTEAIWLLHWVKWLMTNFVAFVAALLYGTLKFLSTGHWTILPPHSGAFDQNVWCGPEESGFIPPQEFQRNAVQIPAGSHLKISSLQGQQRIYGGTKAVACFSLNLWQGSRMLERLTQNDNMYI